MPTYGYQCTQCKHEFQVFQSMKDDAISTCPECSGTVKRLLYPVGVVFKGTGWYINDSRKPEKSTDGGDSSSTEAKKPADATATADAPKTEAKSEPAPAKAES